MKIHRLKSTGQIVQKISSHVHKKVHYWQVLRPFKGREGSRSSNKGEILTVRVSNIETTTK